MKKLNLRSLRVRLTFWYSCALVLVALALAGASRWALAVSLDHALDQSLRYRLIGLRGFIDDNSSGGLADLQTRLAEMGKLGELFQVFGPQGELIARSAGLTRHQVTNIPPPDPGAGMIFHPGGPGSFPLRIATQRIYVNGEALIIEVADPQRKFEGVLREFYAALFIALPFVLAFAALGGYWLSNRALAPVDQIIEESRSLDPGNLAARLSVPATGDELQRLSETLNQMLARVEQSMAQMRQFTADASHELRAPMTLIYTAAQFSLRRERTADELKDALQKILREAKRCTEIINQLLWLARTDAGIAPIALASHDLTSLVKDVVNEIKVLAADKGLSLETDLPASNLHAELDESSFRRLLLILVDNAIKYTPSGGVVKMSVTQETDFIAVKVADTGVGIAKEQLPFVFDRFWRADKVRSREWGGTGLGLAIAREIAVSHGAELEVESVVGEGTTFTVHLRPSA